MALINKEDFEGVIGNIIQKGDYSSGRVLPFEDVANMNWLIPEIGQELFDALVKEKEGTLAVEMGDDYEAEDWAELLVLVKRVVSWSCYLEYLPFSIGSDSGNGLVEDATEKSKPVRLGVLDRREKSTKVLMGREIDRLVSYLFTNRDKFPVWRDSDFAQRMLGLFVRSGVELGKALPESFGSWWLYKRLREEYVSRSEDLLVPVLQKPLYDKIVADLKDDVLVSPYKELRKLAATYLSYYLYADILPTMEVSMTDDGALRVLSDFDGINNRKTPSADQIRKLSAGLDLSVSRTLGKLTAFILKNADDLVEYESPEEDEEASDELLPFQRNRELKGIFGL